MTNLNAVSFYAVDAFLILIIAITIFAGYRKGLIASLLKLIGSIVSMGVSYKLSAQFADLVYTSVFRSVLITKVQENIVNSLDLSGVAGLYNSKMLMIISKLGLVSNATLNRIANEIAGYGDPAKSASMLVDNVLAQPATELVKFVLFIFFLILCLIIVQVLIGIFTKFNRIPVLGGFNRLLGACLGLVEGCLICFVLVKIVSTLLTATPDSLSNLNELIRYSTVFSFFSSINLF